MASKIISTDNEYDLSEVNTLAELKLEIASLKKSVKEKEKELSLGLKKMPHQLIKSTADSLLPSFLNKLISNGTWKLLLSSAAMFANPFSGKFSFKRNILGSAKKLGLMALAKTAFTAWSNKNKAKAKPSIADISKPGVTSLKTKNLKR